MIDERALEEWDLELLASNKARGLGRPPDVPKEVWDAIELPEADNSYPVAGIKKNLLARIAKLENLPEDHKSAVTALMPLALHEMIEVMTSPRSKDSVKMDGAKYLIDHSIGKAKQEIEHSGSLALEIRKQAKEYIAQYGTTDILDVDPIRDETEALAKRFELENFKVGDKGGD